MSAAGVAAVVVLSAVCGCSADAPTAAQSPEVTAPAALGPTAPGAPGPPQTSVRLPDDVPANFTVRIQAGFLNGNASESEFIRVGPEADGTMVLRRGRVTIAANPADNRRVVDREAPVPQPQVAALYQVVRDSGLFDVDDSYLNANAVDPRAPIVTIVVGEYRKTVRASADTHAAIAAVRAALDGL